MPWNDDDCVKVAKFLGYMATDEILNHIQTQMDKLTNGAAIAYVQGYLLQLEKIERDIADTTPFATVAFQSSGTGTRQYQRGDRTVPMRLEGARIVRLISTALNNLALMSDYFEVGSGVGSKRVRRM